MWCFVAVGLCAVLVVLYKSTLAVQHHGLDTHRWLRKNVLKIAFISIFTHFFFYFGTGHLNRVALSVCCDDYVPIHVQGKAAFTNSICCFINSLWCVVCCLLLLLFSSSSLHFMEDGNATLCRICSNFNLQKSNKQNKKYHKDFESRTRAYASFANTRNELNCNREDHGEIMPVSEYMNIWATPFATFIAANPPFSFFIPFNCACLRCVTAYPRLKIIYAIATSSANRPVHNAIVSKCLEVESEQKETGMGRGQRLAGSSLHKAHIEKRNYLYIYILRAVEIC